MIVIFIVAVVIAFTIIFFTGFWAGKHTERAKQKRMLSDLEIALNKHTYVSMGTGPEAPPLGPGRINDAHIQRG